MNELWNFKNYEMSWTKKKVKTPTALSSEVSSVNFLKDLEELLSNLLFICRIFNDALCKPQKCVRILLQDCFKARTKLIIHDIGDPTTEQP